MKCPYCEKEMEKGITYLDDIGSTAVVYVPDQPENEKKKGLFKKLPSNTRVLVKYKRDKEESYRCPTCRKILVVLEDE